MPIDTYVAGDPEELFAVADWVRRSFGAGVTETAGQIYAARNDAESAWDGSAADGFRELMTQGARAADGLADEAVELSRKFDEVAGVLRRTQREMDYIRSAAARAGLEVVNGSIMEPGHAPPGPGPAPIGSAATPEALQEHHDAVAAQQTHAARVRAYNTARVDAEHALAEWRAAVEDTRNTASDFVPKKFFDLANVGAGTAAAAYKQVQLGNTHAAAREARFVGALARNNGHIDPARFHQLLKESGRWEAKATGYGRSVSRLGKVARTGPVVGSGALAGLSIASDMSNGESAVQAVASNGGGFAASYVVSSAVTGAAAGTVVGGPVGFAIGGVVGVGAGVVTSGAIDSLFENDFDVEQSVSEWGQEWGELGNDAADLGEDVVDGAGDLGEDVVNGAGDVGEDVAGRAEDAWNKIV
ncbi:hypothetical protein H0B56_19780 [Haloechinothrix sp. YIM 98757]|uniref:WXG100 family type VII secretion target n=1 Tax=Haloechinothrix aidingensis TaxID=2752311 RepID=A0A838AEU5_9PSEU|nr:hypothetical protein [Haloechinothrix aidingensis]MBA0127792.1 hypothetical protein [Haloechinothrix aidingensis]